MGTKPFKGIIPSKFNIGGVEIKVIDVENEINTSNYGRTQPLQAEVRLQKTAGNKPIAETQRVNTFWHEVVHYILDAMGEIQEEKENERFTTCFSNFLNEVIQSCEIEENKTGEQSCQ